MIQPPVNDTECLGKLTELATRNSETEAIRQLAGNFENVSELQAFVRGLPQRNDDGTGPGPFIDCGAVKQRARNLPGNPNCFERSALYLAVAENIDPEAKRQLATMNIDGYGLHTFPVENLEDGELVSPTNIVVLDPEVPATRNAFAAGVQVERRRNNAGSMLAGIVRPLQMLQWILALANESQRALAAPIRNSAESIDSLLLRGQPLGPSAVRDLGYTLALARREAGLFGDWAVRRVDAVARNLSLFGVRIRPDVPKLKRVGRAFVGLGGELAGPAFLAYLASQGVPPQVVMQLENELQKEGLTLGSFAPPEQASPTPVPPTRAPAQTMPEPRAKPPVRTTGFESLMIGGK